MKLLKVLVLGVVLSSAAAFANDAGCGLGSLVIKDNTKVMQILAVTTNGTFGSQTFGITTGTSNCTANGFVMNEKEIQYFAEANQNDITREMSQGSGEKLSTLAALYGCSAQGKAAFAKMTQSSFDKIVPSEHTNASQMIQNLNSQLRSNSAVAHACGING